MNEQLSFGFDHDAVVVRYSLNSKSIAELRLVARDGVVPPAGALLLQAFLNRVLPKQPVEAISA